MSFARAALVLSLLAGCQPQTFPGDALGTYRVSATLAENNCGAGYPSPSEFLFVVELRREAVSTTGYWRVLDRPFVAGRIEPEGAFEFLQQAVNQVAVGGATCALSQSESVRGTLASEIPDAALSDGGVDAGGGVVAALYGENAVNIAAEATPSCLALTQAQGGPFAQLPCTARISLVGTPE